MISADLFQNLCALIHPQTFPLAVKFIEDEDQIPEKTVRPSRYGIKISLCQWTTLSRTWGRTAGVLAEDINCTPCLAALGLKRLSTPDALSRYFMDMGYFQSKQGAMNAVQQLEPIPAGTFRGVVMHPANTPFDFDPDIYWIYGTPAQMARLASGLVYKTGELIDSRSTGFGISCLSMTKPFITGKPCLVHPGRGERILAGTNECEMAISIPAFLMEDLIDGLEKTHERGTRYPIQKYMIYEPPILKPMKTLGQYLFPTSE